MHIAMFLDQHPRSLGGIQTSAMLQRKYLEKLGHKVTFVTPSSGKRLIEKGFFTLPSWPLTPSWEFTFTANARRARKRLDRSQRRRTDKFDLVHIHADMWSAIIGIGFARRNNLPVVMTSHFNLAKGTQEVIGKWPAKLLFWVLSREFLKHVKLPLRGTTTDAWEYMKLITSEVDVVLTPSAHFAKELAANGITAPIQVMHNGVDDDRVASTLAGKETSDEPDRVIHMIWAGRFQHEKRLLEFIDALRIASLEGVVVDVYGRGPLGKKARELVEAHGLQDQVIFHGRAAHARMLSYFANADVHVQSSVGFETQGMTVFEAAAVGTPSILCDHNIAEEFPPNSHWVVKDDSNQALAAELVRAVKDLRTGDSRGVSLVGNKELLQSHLTARAVKLYEQLIENGGKYTLPLNG
jgi:glycosyltransferase involved in cell wall biosynthesis